jgi:CRISPR-associated protein Csh2
MAAPKKSEILFLYETSYNIPNGDPFTGEQRYDEETKQILVSDVRIKRFIRDYLVSKKGISIYIKQKDNAIQEDLLETETTDGETEDKKGSGSARRIDELIKQFSKELGEATPKGEKAKKSFSQALFLMKKCIDVRLFGGISTKKTDAVNLTGPVQFALLNPSKNAVKLKEHQNTSVLESKQGNKQGAIATTTLVPYSLIQIHGWVNPKVAETTGMTDNDLKLMYEGLWYGTSGDGSSHSRSKVGQNSVLLLEIIYKENNQKIYGVDRLIQLKVKNGKKGEELRSMDDYELDFSKLFEAAKADKVEKIKFYTEIEALNITKESIKKLLTTKTKDGDNEVENQPSEEDVKKLFDKFEEIEFNGKVESSEQNTAKQ